MKPVDAVRVVNVTGYPRSGTTIFSRLLGELPSVCCIGEAIFVWTRGLLDNDLCGCGQPFWACSFWKAVGERAFGGWQHVDAERLANASRTLYPALGVAPRARRQQAPDVVHLAHSIRTMLQAAHDVSGAFWLVDSSKAYRYGGLLNRLPRTEAVFVHMVRDSRGIRYSARKQVRRPEVQDRLEYISNYSAGRLALSWTIHNVLHELQQGRCRGLRVRYEDFARSPDEAQRRVLGFLDLGPTGGGSDPPSSAAVDLGVAHTVSGNPNRFILGPLVVQEDTAWRRSLPWADRVTTTLITFPLLAHYGYLTRS